MPIVPALAWAVAREDKERGLLFLADPFHARRWSRFIAHARMWVRRDGAEDALEAFGGPGDKVVPVAALDPSSLSEDATP